jgi:anti-anti-sigma factor
MADDGRVLYAHRNGTCVLRFEGAIRYTMAHALDTFINELFAHDPPRQVVADLSEAESVDSTGIGLLAKLARCQRKAGFGNPVLFSSNADMNELLSSVCLDEVFDLTQRAPGLQDETVLQPTQPSEPQLAQTILDAHLALSELSEKNRVTFRDVVEGLARDVERHRA